MATPSDRTIVITGASGALGRAIADRLASSARLVLIDRHGNASAPGAEALAGDVTEDPSMAAVAAVVAQRHARVDALIHVAGGFEMGEPVSALSRESWDRLMNLNAWSFAVVARHFLPLLRAGGDGRIVAASASAASQGGAQMGAYAASKAALQRLVESLAQELRPDGIAVNSIAPTVLDTSANRSAMPDADRTSWTSLDDAAEAVAFLVSPAARAVCGRHLVLGR